MGAVSADETVTGCHQLVGGSETRLVAAKPAQAVLPPRRI